MNSGKLKGKMSNSQKAKRLISRGGCGMLALPCKVSSNFGYFFWLLREKLYRHFRRLSKWPEFVILTLQGWHEIPKLRRFLFMAIFNPARMLSHA